MVQEIIEFMDKLPAAILARGQRLRAGIHFLINIDAEQQISLDLKEHQWQYIHAKASSAAEGWEKLAERQEHAWMVDANKCIDKALKGVKGSKDCFGPQKKGDYSLFKKSRL
ncbi:hypothetical protein PPO43_12635 [Saprospira sp. CCB-QB6]|uniref:hypothetical protein n=1 Tax=Saprospira sp. CCB-QB6 TaxID=3023936 RepID=UPI00234C0253|nr:hypothetical protein [Saprospira sp. CCB-QB6]WCL80818.1 hypothetical protein PPO43_12635 [Saprospira sp. CCB-QB6]